MFADFRRKLREVISDLRQEKLYLELRVEQLTLELAAGQDSTQQQRLRALDLRYELREVSHSDKLFLPFFSVLSCVWIS